MWRSADGHGVALHDKKFHIMGNTSKNIQIKLLQKGKETLWDQYVANAPATSLYHLSGWKRVIETTFRHKTFYLYALKSEQIVGILPLVFLKSFLFGKFFRLSAI